METYDYIIRVSRMGGRHEDDASTMTGDDQRQECIRATGVVSTGQLEVQNGEKLNSALGFSTI
jgi:hypothetical protein